MSNENKIIDLLEQILDKLDHIASTNKKIAVNTSDINDVKSQLKDIAYDIGRIKKNTL